MGPLSFAPSNGRRRLGGSRILRLVSVPLGLVLAAPLGVALGSNPTPRPAAAATSTFSFNWTQAPASPLPWVPAAVNDWDLVANIDGPTGQTGSMYAQHGADCSAPPAVHLIVNLTDSAFICNRHMMTAINGGGDAYTSYGAVYFGPAQLVDFSGGTATVSWQVSSYRTSGRDWWDLWITPFGENLVLPLFELPSYNGPPRDALHIRVDNGVCQVGQPGTLGSSNGNPMGSILRAEKFSGFVRSDLGTTSACIEDALGGSSATLRAPFRLDLSQGHLRVTMPGSSAVLVDTDVSLPFSQGVVQWGHHSYNPSKGCDGPSCGPNTYHWSNFSISPAQPFTMLRGDLQTVNAATSQVVHLPQPAPANGFLRFAGLGQIGVSFDGGRSFQGARLQLQNGQADDGIMHPEAFSSYWMPVPAGTTQVVFRGQPNVYGQPFWIQDIAVWSLGGAPAAVTSPPPPVVPAPFPRPVFHSVNFRQASQSLNKGGLVRRPGQAQEGDLLLAALEVDADPVTVTPPPGWHLLKDQVSGQNTPMAFHAMLFYKVSDGQEPRTYHFQVPANVWVDVTLLRYSGVNVTDPFDGPAVGSSGSGPTIQASSLQTTAPLDRLVVFVINFAYGVWSAPSAMSVRSSFDSNASADEELGGPGATGARTLTSTSPGAVAALAIALRRG